MKIIKNQALTFPILFITLALGFIACQNNTGNSSEKPTNSVKSNIFTKKLASDAIEVNDIWLLKDMDLEKGEILKFYKITEINKDSVKYIKSKIMIDTTISNWQSNFTKQLNFDVNINFRVHSSVKDKWLSTQKIIGIYKR
jgi:hypothetical protein